MGKDDKKIRGDEMWCPECGAPIKKGFFTCSNCRLKVRMTQDINREQDHKAGPVSNKKTKGKTKEESDTPIGDVEKNPGNPFQKNPLKKSGHPRYWSF